MSYSFAISAANKADAKLAVSKKLEETAMFQPSHELDVKQAEAAAHSFIDLAAEPPEGMLLYVAVHGSIMWTEKDGVKDITSTGVGISVYHTPHRP